MFFWGLWLFLLGLIVSYGMESVSYPLFRHGIGTLICAIALILLGKKMSDKFK
jgi:uncharacterized membrane protein YccC